MGLIETLLDDPYPFITALITIIVVAYAISLLRGLFAPPPHPTAHRFPPQRSQRETGPQVQSSQLIATTSPQHQGHPTHPLQPPPHTNNISSNNNIKCVTISVPGTLMKCSTDEAVPIQSAVQSVQSLLSRPPNPQNKNWKPYDLYLVCQVDDDVAEALIRAALEHAGIVTENNNNNKNSLPMHRLLFCSSMVGKTSIIRQLEPDVHIDGDRNTIEQLQRFIPSLVYIKDGDTSTGRGQNDSLSSSSPVVAKRNVTTATTLHEALGERCLNLVV